MLRETQKIKRSCAVLDKSVLTASRFISVFSCRRDSSRRWRGASVVRTAFAKLSHREGCVNRVLYDHCSWLFAHAVRENCTVVSSRDGLAVERRKVGGSFRIYYTKVSLFDRWRRRSLTSAMRSQVVVFPHRTNASIEELAGARDTPLRIWGTSKT